MPYGGRSVTNKGGETYEYREQGLKILSDSPRQTGILLVKYRLWLIVRQVFAYILLDYHDAA